MNSLTYDDILYSLYHTKVKSASFVLKEKGLTFFNSVTPGKIWTESTNNTDTVYCAR